MRNTHIEQTSNTNRNHRPREGSAGNQRQRPYNTICNARNNPDYPLIYFLIETLVNSRRSYDSHKTDASTKPLRKEIRPPTPLLSYRYATSELTSAASGKAVETQTKKEDISERERHPAHKGK